MDEIVQSNTEHVEKLTKCYLLLLLIKGVLEQWIA